MCTIHLSFNVVSRTSKEQNPYYPFLHYLKHLISLEQSYISFQLSCGILYTLDESFGQYLMLPISYGYTLSFIDSRYSVG